MSQQNKRAEEINISMGDVKYIGAEAYVKLADVQIAVKQMNEHHRILREQEIAEAKINLLEDMPLTNVKLNDSYILAVTGSDLAKKINELEALRSQVKVDKGIV